MCASFRDVQKLKGSTASTCRPFHITASFFITKAHSLQSEYAHMLICSKPFDDHFPYQALILFSMLSGDVDGALRLCSRYKLLSFLGDDEAADEVMRITWFCECERGGHFPMASAPFLCIRSFSSVSSPLLFHFILIRAIHCT